MIQPRVVLLTGDLLFGSKVEGMIREAGAEVTLAATQEAAVAEAAGASLLIVDLTTDAFDGTRIVATEPTPTLGFYAHTDDQTRVTALANGFAQVVPRSRMMREGPQLIATLLSR